MLESKKSIREQIARTRPSRGNQGWPVEIRRRVGRHAKERRDTGESWRSIGTSLGISSTTIRGWVNDLSTEERGKGGEERESVSMVPVVVTDGVVPSTGGVPSLVLVSPRGYRVEGLGLSEMIAVLERLG